MDLIEGNIEGPKLLAFTNLSYRDHGYNGLLNCFLPVKPTI